MARSVFFKSFLEVVVGIHIGKDDNLEAWSYAQPVGSH